jgi:hypothetical protein
MTQTYHNATWAVSATTEYNEVMLDATHKGEILHRSTMTVANAERLAALLLKAAQAARAMAKEARE